MSIFSAPLPEQLPENWAAHVLRALGQDCALCGGVTPGPLVCTACERALPFLGTACVRCALPLGHAGVCGACLRRPPRFDAAAAAFVYRFPVDRMVQRFKHGADFALGAWLAQALARHCASQPRPDLLVVPPLTPRRLRERGFNQAAELARAVGRRLGIPCDVHALRRVREMPSQQGLGARERRANLRGAFRCRARLEGLRVAVVDDVLTTGATAGAIAQVLHEAGAAHVAVWAVARTPAPED